MNSLELELKVHDLEHKLNMLTYTVESLQHQLEISKIMHKGLEDRHQILFNHVMKQPTV